MGFGTDSSNESIIASELLGRMPRRTRLQGTGIALSIGGVLILGLMTTAASSMAIDISQQVPRRAELRTNSSVVTGWKDQLLSGGRGRDEKLEYSFVVNGKHYMGDTRVPLSHLHDVAHSYLLQIRYLPENPTVNHPADWEWSPEWMQILFMPLGFAMGIVLLTAVLMERQLVAKGEPASATIIDCSPNGKGGFRIRYEFRTTDGTLVQGTGWSASDQDTDAKIPVLYLLQNPKRNEAYPGQLVRVSD